jgi:hypothetical protein
MKDWIMELCPEIAEWQAELISEAAKERVEAEREACAKLIESGRFGIGSMMSMHTDESVAEAIRARGQA